MQIVSNKQPVIHMQNTINMQSVFGKHTLINMQMVKHANGHEYSNHH